MNDKNQSEVDVLLNGWNSFLNKSQRRMFRDDKMNYLRENLRNNGEDFSSQRTTNG